MNVIELGQRLIGEFFFVHAAEARLRSVVGKAGSAFAGHGSGEPARRCYEFLHATFGEYLIASRILEELVDVAKTTLGGRRGPREPGDDLLFALLSHQPVATRRSIVGFAIELSAKLSNAERSDIIAVLDILIGSYRQRYGPDRYLAYRPTPMDRIRQYAAYSANLIMLRVALEPGNAPVPLDMLLRETEDSTSIWRSTVSLWRSGLDEDGMRAVVASLSLSNGALGLAANKEISATSYMLDVWAAQLVGDSFLEDQLRFGMATRNQIIYTDERRNDWADMMTSWLIPFIAGVSDVYFIRRPSSDTSQDAIIRVARLIMRALVSRKGALEIEAQLIRLLLDLPRVFVLETRASGCCHTAPRACWYDSRTAGPGYFRSKLEHYMYGSSREDRLAVGGDFRKHWKRVGFVELAFALLCTRCVAQGNRAGYRRASQVVTR